MLFDWNFKFKNPSIKPSSTKALRPYIDAQCIATIIRLSPLLSFRLRFCCCLPRFFFFFVFVSNWSFTLKKEFLSYIHSITRKAWLWSVGSSRLVRCSTAIFQSAARTFLENILFCFKFACEVIRNGIRVKFDCDKRADLLRIKINEKMWFRDFFLHARHHRQRRFEFFDNTEKNIVRKRCATRWKAKTKRLSRNEFN